MELAGIQEYAERMTDADDELARINLEDEIRGEDSRYAEMLQEKILTLLSNRIDSAESLTDKIVGFINNFDISPSLKMKLGLLATALIVSFSNSVGNKVLAAEVQDLNIQQLVCPVNNEKPEGWVVGRTLEDRDKLKDPQEALRLFGDHHNGIYEQPTGNRKFNGREKYTLDPENILILVIDRGVEGQNLLPLAFANTASRFSENKNIQVTPTIQDILNVPNTKMNNTAKVTPEQIKFSILIPRDDCRKKGDKKNYDWHQAIFEVSSAIKGKKIPNDLLLENMATINLILDPNDQQRFIYNLTAAWAPF